MLDEVFLLLYQGKFRFFGFRSGRVIIRFIGLITRRSEVQILSPQPIAEFLLYPHRLRYPTLSCSSLGRISDPFGSLLIQRSPNGLKWKASTRGGFKVIPGLTGSRSLSENSSPRISRSLSRLFVHLGLNLPPLSPGFCNVPIMTLPRLFRKGFRRVNIMKNRLGNIEEEL